MGRNGLFLALLLGVLVAALPAADAIIESVIAARSAEHPRNSEGDVIALQDGTLLVAWTDF